MSKEIWIDTYEKLYDEAIDKGFTHEAAEEYADRYVNYKYADRIADMMDYARMMKQDQLA